MVPLNLAEHLEISKKMSFFVKINALVATIFDSAKWVVSMRL